MNRNSLLSVGVGIVVLSACATAKVTSSGGQDMASAQIEAYNGPKARIAVADFEDKMSSSGQYRAEYGRGMSDMLTNALFQSNRYIVLEREKLEAVIAEQNLGASGRIKKETAAPIGEIEGAELLVTAAITGFDPGASGGSGSMAGIPGGNLLGAVTGSFKKAHVAMDLRVVDTRTARVLAATSVEGSASSFGAGGVGIGGQMSGGLGGFAKSPMETAIRKMITEAVKFIVAQTPQEFYRFSATGVPIGGAKARAAAVEEDEETAVEERPKPAPKLAKPAKPSTGQSMAKAPAPDQLGTPKARKTIQSIKSEVDPNLVAHLNEVKRRGAVLTVVVTLTVSANSKEAEYFSISRGDSKVMDYETAETYDLVKIDGYTAGRVKPGEVKTFQTTFKAPTTAKTVGIIFSGLGTFDDVVIE
jgi:curli biogenesis system outer membrane secretion channel CsgG